MSRSPYSNEHRVGGAPRRMAPASAAPLRSLAGAVACAPRRLAAAAAITLLLLAAGSFFVHGPLRAANAAASSPAVAVYPFAGTKNNLPQTQITFRGVSASQIGHVSVVGSVSGNHSGTIKADSDGNGGSFIPSQPFTAGETVTVTTSLNIVGGNSGTFSFGIEHPGPTIGPGPLPVVSAGSNGLQHFRSRPDLVPPSISVLHNSSAASKEDIFVAPQFGPSQNGPMILDPQGRLIWFQPTSVSQKLLMTDFRVQKLGGQQVLTWWRGSTNHGSGRGVGIIFDRNYRQITTVSGGNGLQADLHEFYVTPQGQAYIIAVSPVHLTTTNKPLMDAVIQEIDIKTGLVLFEWHAYDHVPLSESVQTPKSPGYVFDPYHMNSIYPLPDGNIMVSMRNTNTVYEINRQTGQIVWRLGGKRSSFKMGPGTSTVFQHDAIMQPDGTITIFDDGAGPPRVHPYSRGIRVRLDRTHMTATLVKEYDHSPQISTLFEGSTQVLPGGDVFLGWGQLPYFSEDNAAGQEVFDARFTSFTASYRAYRFSWSAQPPTTPAIAISPNSDGSTSLYGSWNGATDVSSWEVLLGPSPHSLTPVGSASRSGFETRIVAHSASPYFALQALGSKGQVLATTNAQATPSHVAIYGHSAFVPPSGFGGIPSGCFTGSTCHVTMTVSSGRTVLAKTGSESIPQNGGGLVFFRLSSQGRSMLAHASGGRLPVSVNLHDSSGTSATVSLNLIPFSTSGSGPTRGTISNGSTVRFIGSTEFVSSGGVGGVLAACTSAVPCHVRAAITAGGTTIANTGSEFLGANELGYVIFNLTSQGRSMLAHASGNQLGAQVTLSNGSDSAKANVALVQFH